MPDASKIISADSITRWLLSKYILIFKSGAILFFNSSKILINEHITFLEKYVKVLTVDGQIQKSINIIKQNRAKENSQFFEAELLILIDKFKKKKFNQNIKLLDEFQKYRDYGSFNYIIYEVLKSYNDLFLKKELNSNNKDLIAVVGPCIGKKNYKVKSDFFERFIGRNDKNNIFFEKIENETYLFDLRGYINKEILNLNIENIENIEKDTFSDLEFFYSYRRSRLNKEQDYGRCISVILMT